MEAAALTPAHALKEPTEDAPKEPGFLAGLRRSIQSLTEGAFESIVELGPAAVGLVELAARLAPARALVDPEGWKKDNEQFFGSIGSHPGKFFGGFIDLDTWKEDPAKAIGKLLPDLATLGLGMAKEGALRADEAEEKLIDAGEATDAAAAGPGFASQVDAASTDARITELGMNPHSAAGLAARAQLDALRNPDQWVPIRLHDGDLIAVTDGGKTIIPVSGNLTSDGRKFFGGIQRAPKRYRDVNGVPGPPQSPGQI
ncbi:MAG TPA: hypothetical protein VHV82_23295, partial [Sporichthyaceae bacterium]|nr:hypothetical protein [Sporichthyaceae bacterium]